MVYTETKKHKLKEQYDQLLPKLYKAEKHLLYIVEQALSRIEDKRLVRAKIRCQRVKSFDRVRRKAEAQGLKPAEACLSISDLVGIRVVCSTVEDVYRFRELIREELPLPFNGPVEEQDYIAKGKETGYRGLHLNFRIDVGEPFKPMLIPCEVQIRTLLQDSWADLVHSDIYKDDEELPEDLRGRTQDLASLLAAADQIAGKVRARVMRESKVVPESVQLDSITKEGLTYIFADVFGRSPSEYAVQRAYNACLDTEVTKVSTLRAKLANKSFRKEISKAYRDELQLGYDISAEDIFLTAPVAVARGDEEAVQLARMFARTEREEVDAIWRREVLGELPSSYDEFVEQLRMGETDMKHVAEALGATTRCAICRETIVNGGTLLEAISEYYEVDTDYDLLGYFDEGQYRGGHSLCSYHAYQVDKDD